jgi:hypothetical protein
MRNLSFLDYEKDEQIIECSFGWTQVLDRCYLVRMIDEWVSDQDWTDE